jgi:hypothetical protein
MSQGKEPLSSFKPALLIKTELEWLHSKIQVSKPYEYWLRYNIKKKIKTLTDFEIPLLIEKGFIISNENEGPESVLDSNTRPTLPLRRLSSSLSLDMAGVAC